MVLHVLKLAMLSFTLRLSGILTNCLHGEPSFPGQMYQILPLYQFVCTIMKLSRT